LIYTKIPVFLDEGKSQDNKRKKKTTKQKWLKKPGKKIPNIRDRQHKTIGKEYI
jgi:hypothetical protein